MAPVPHAVTDSRTCCLTQAACPWPFGTVQLHQTNQKTLTMILSWWQHHQCYR